MHSSDSLQVSHVHAALSLLCIWEQHRCETTMSMLALMYKGAKAGACKWPWSCDCIIKLSVRLMPLIVCCCPVRLSLPLMLSLKTAASVSSLCHAAASCTTAT